MSAQELAPELTEPEQFSLALGTKIQELHECGYLVYADIITRDDEEVIFVITILDKNSYRYMTGQIKAKTPEIIPKFFINHSLAGFGITEEEAFENALRPWQIYLEDDAAA